jgi:hypothetical protein
MADQLKDINIVAPWGDDLRLIVEEIWNDQSAAPSNLTGHTAEFVVAASKPELDSDPLHTETEAGAGIDLTAYTTYTDATDGNTYGKLPITPATAAEVEDTFDRNTTYRWRFRLINGSGVKTTLRQGELIFN